VALLSYSNFGSRDGDSAFKMRETYQLLKQVAPDMIVEGEMQGDLALNQDLRERYIPETVLKGEANLLLFPNLDSANLSMTLLKEMNNALAVGPILMGTRRRRISWALRTANGTIRLQDAGCHGPGGGYGAPPRRADAVQECPAGPP
jgi:phosphotransacetylase